MTNNDFGLFAVVLAWALALVATLTGFWAGKQKSYAWMMTARQATILVFFAVAVSFISLGYAFYSDDYSNQFVWQYSNKDMQGFYKFSAIWGGMDGSMLLWCLMLAFVTAIVAFRFKKYPQTLVPWVLGVANSSTLFFLTIVVFVSNPFRYINATFIPPDGNGLNPLLQNPYMVIHPPMLYAGFTIFAIPFALCTGALLRGLNSNEWIRLTRTWTLIAWGFLTAGIVLGGYWAYLELGWGGFWAWDPVENASFFPWLTATALLHSVMVQERKQMLMFWNVLLVTLTYGLTVFGTFLTRSGIVQSVHAFASTDIGWVFLTYLGIIVVFVGWLLWLRRDELKSKRAIESFLSREAAFLLNNLVLLSICFATLWGVMFPVLSEAVTGAKQTVGIPFFNAVNVPLFLLLLFLMGIGPLIAWRRASLANIRKLFLRPFIAGIIASALLVWAGVTSFYAVISYGLCVFVLLTIIGEFHRGLKVQSLTGKTSVVAKSRQLFKRHRIRYGGYIVHLGVLVAAVGITASMAHKVEEEFELGAGETHSVGRFTFLLEKTGFSQSRNYQSLFAVVKVKSRKDKRVVTELYPELRNFAKSKETTTEVALSKGLREDIYLILVGLSDDGQRAALKIFINPLQSWLWIGVAIMLFGTVIVAFPARVLIDEVKETDEERATVKVT